MTILIERWICTQLRRNTANEQFRQDTRRFDCCSSTSIGCGPISVCVCIILCLLACKACTENDDSVESFSFSRSFFSVVFVRSFVLTFKYVFITYGVWDIGVKSKWTSCKVYMRWRLSCYLTFMKYATWWKL